MRRPHQPIHTLMVLCIMVAAASCRAGAEPESSEPRGQPAQDQAEEPREGEGDSEVRIDHAKAKAEERDPAAKDPAAEESTPIEREDDFEVFWKDLQRMLVEDDEEGLQGAMAEDVYAFYSGSKEYYGAIGPALAETDLSAVKMESEKVRSLELSVLISTDEYGMEFWSGYYLQFEKADGAWQVTRFTQTSG